MGIEINGSKFRSSMTEVQEPIDNLLGLLGTVKEEHGKAKALELKRILCDFMGIKEHSWDTNIATRRSFDDFKIRMAIPVAQNYIANL